MLPAPRRTARGYRDFPERIVQRLAIIRDAQGAGLSLAEIRSVLALRDAGAFPCALSPRSSTATLRTSTGAWRSSSPRRRSFRGWRSGPP
ncbi:MerR family DNA-binding protein [Streptomyces sp. NPDC090026]|uniref:MerR family DNA-binding protein n=1 Tax=Streptomyces sp. NPDC090026 TaxID=3365923 RepID=UPI00382A58BB